MLIALCTTVYGTIHNKKLLFFVEKKSTICRIFSVPILVQLFESDVTLVQYSLTFLMNNFICRIYKAKMYIVVL